MVTKVLSKIYLPGYHPLQDIMEDAKSRWSSYYQDKKLSDLIYNSCAQRLVNGYSVHDKEMIKRIMLEHEAIFRKQVCELHRLYRIQKDLMNGFQKRVFHRSSIREEGSHSTSFTSQRQSECTEKISPVSPLPVGNTSYSDMPFEVSERPYFSFKKEISVQSDQIQASPKDTDTLDCKPQQGRTCGLQLPADVCKNTEETVRSEQLNISEWPNSASTLKNGTCSLYSENDIKLSLGSGHRVDHQLSNSAGQISRSSCCLVDLNKPTTETSYETPAYLASDKLLDLTHKEWNRGHHSSMRSNANFMDRHADQKCPSDILLKNLYTKGEWSFFNFESGNETSTVDNSSHTFYKSHVPKLSESLKLNANVCHEYFPSDQDNPGSWSRDSRQKPTHEIETSPRFHHAFSNSSLISPSVPSTTTILQADFISNASSLVSSWRRPSNSKSNMPVTVCALRCFNGSANLSNESRSSKIEPQSPISYCQKWQSSRNLTTTLGTDTIASHTNVFHYDLHLDSNSLLYSKVASGNPYQINDGKGNLHGHLHRSCLASPEDSFTFRQDPVYYGDVNDKVSDGSSLLKKASSSERAEKTAVVGFSFSNGFSFPNGPSKLVLNSNTVAPEKELGLSACNQQEVASSLTFKHHKMQGNEVSDSNGKEVVGFPINSSNEHSSLSFSKRHFTDNTMFSENDSLILAGLSCDENILNSQKMVDDSTTETCGAKSNSKCRNHINLNAEFTYVDDSTSPLIVPQDEVHIHSCQLITIFGAKIASGTDLEAPISQAKMDIVDQHKDIYSSSKVDSEKKDYSCDTLVKSAADNLVVISKNGNVHQSESGSHNSSLSQFETLRWFAEVVSCSSERTEVVRKGKDGDGYTQSSHDDELDLFEAMTLKLQEMQVDQYWCSPEESVGKDDREPTGAASLLDRKLRRGQARKRRHRRDFQTDILPGLASLARHEVAEDLQNFGEMMEIAGRALHTGLTRKRTSRHGVNFPTKGRRKSRRLAVTVEEVRIIPHQPSEHNNSDKGIDGSSMIAWGRTTRRCRRPRSLPGSLFTPVT